MKKNKVVNVRFWGGLISWLNSPKNRMEACIVAQNNEGWSVRQVIDADNNAFYILLGLVVLFFTFGIYMPVSGKTIIFEKIEK